MGLTKVAAARRSELANIDWLNTRGDDEDARASSNCREGGEQGVSGAGANTVDNDRSTFPPGAAKVRHSSPDCLSELDCLRSVSLRSVSLPVSLYSSPQLRLATDTIIEVQDNDGEAKMCGLVESRDCCEGKKGITGGDEKSLDTPDMGAVNNLLLELMSALTSIEELEQTPPSSLGRISADSSIPEMDIVSENSISLDDGMCVAGEVDNPVTKLEKVCGHSIMCLYSTSELTSSSVLYIPIVHSPELGLTSEVRIDRLFKFTSCACKIGEKGD